MAQEQFRAMRHKLLVDRKVQGALLVRIVGYWGLMVLAIGLFLICWQIVVGPPRPFVLHFKAFWDQYAAAILGAALMLPVVLFDVLRMTNRFAGPILRLRRNLRLLADGEKVHRLRFRDGDYWQDFAEDFNSLLARVKQLEAAAAKQQNQKDEEEELALSH